MPRRNRDDFIRQLWLADFEFERDLPHAQLFVRSQDGARILVPKREYVGAKWADARLRGEPERPAVEYESPCCRAESTLHRILVGMMYLRCTACTYLWERPAPERPSLRVVE